MKNPQEIEQAVTLFLSIQRRYPRSLWVEELRLDLLERLTGLKNKFSTDRRYEDALQLLTWLSWVDPENISKIYSQERNFYENILKREGQSKDDWPRITQFKADRNYVISGYQVNITWKTLNTTSIIFHDSDGQSHTIKGNSVKRTLYTNENSVTIKRFKLQVSNPLTDYEQEIQIVVLPVPILENLHLPVIEMNLKALTQDSPSFSFPLQLDNSVQPNAPVEWNMPFDYRTEIITSNLGSPGIDDIRHAIVIQEDAVNSFLFPNDIFRILYKKQKEIVYIIKSIWKKKLKRTLKKTFRQNSTV